MRTHREEEEERPPGADDVALRILDLNAVLHLVVTHQNHIHRTYHHVPPASITAAGIIRRQHGTAHGRHSELTSRRNGSVRYTGPNDAPCQWTQLLRTLHKCTCTTSAMQHDNSNAIDETGENSTSTAAG